MCETKGFLPEYEPKQPANKKNIMRSIPYLIFISLIAFIFGLFWGIRHVGAATLQINEPTTPYDYWTTWKNGNYNAIKFTAESSFAVDNITIQGCRLFDYPDSSDLWLEIHSWDGSNNAGLATSSIMQLGNLPWIGSTRGTDCATTTEDIWFNFPFNDYNITLGTDYLVMFFTSTTTNDQVFVGTSEVEADYDLYTSCTQKGNSCALAANKNMYIWISDGLTPGGTSNITWFFPQDGYEISNSEWNDWGVYYQLATSSLMDTWLLKISYGNNDYEWVDWDLITTSTAYTYWTVDRGFDIPDGDVWAVAEILGTDCGDPENDETCYWESLANSSVLNFTSSSTGRTIFDYGLPGFIAATTTDEHELIERLYNDVFRQIFPLSLYFDIYDILESLELQAQLQTDDDLVNYTLDDLIPPEYTGMNFASSTILNKSLFEDNMPEWNTRYYPFMQNSIWLVFFFFIVISTLKFFTGIIK